jgi:hypothetical protein
MPNIFHERGKCVFFFFGKRLAYAKPVPRLVKRIIFQIGNKRLAKTLFFWGLAI